MRSKDRKLSTRRGTQMKWAAFIIGLLFSEASAFSSYSFRDQCPAPSRRFEPLSVAASLDGQMIPILEHANQLKRNSLELAKRSDYSNSVEIIRDLVAMLDVANEPTKIELGSIVDEAVKSFTNMAFSQPHRGRKASKRIHHGLQAIDLHLAASDAFPSPYAAIPRDTLLRALRAVSGFISNYKKSEYDNDIDSPRTEIAFRLLQRLLTGNGVRAPNGKNFLSERDFNAVLNAMSNVGRMDLAHKIVALQKRTPSAPPLGIVTYSILLKGYGRQRDIHNVEMTLLQAENNGIVPDTIFFNTVIDAFINCRSIAKAKIVFNQMVSGTRKNQPRPNQRTYNTMLKGFAQNALVQDALQLAEKMESKRLWDDVTTNTLVSALVTGGDFDQAEKILSIYTKTEIESQPPRQYHPNVEAYTELLDGYAKVGNLESALNTLRLMRNRNVQPNEYTYSCVIGALARAKKVEQAEKLLQFMQRTGVKPSVVTYNAFISGLTSQKETRTEEQQEVIPMWDGQDVDFDKDVDEAVRILKVMLSQGVRPNVVTTLIILEAFSKCSGPMVVEARSLVSKFEADGLIPSNQLRIKTAMIRVLGAAKDLKSALAEFRTLTNPDIIAINAFLDVACRCNQPTIAFSTFAHFFESEDRPEGPEGPDLITYSILINSKLKQNNVDAAREAQGLYMEMQSRGISPDITLFDTLLSNLVRGGRVALRKKDIQFTLALLKSGEKLPWMPGEFEERKQTARAVMIGGMSEVWKENEEYFGMSFEKQEEKGDQLFKKKGWNKVDSGFRLWGGTMESTEDLSSVFLAEDNDEPLDEFLASKGWNDVDSSFRFF